MDIVVNSGQQDVGYLATTTEEYAEAVMKIIALSTDERERIRKAARASMKRFSEETFDERWEEALTRILTSE